jgi:hypothetical protein
VLILLGIWLAVGFGLIWTICHGRRGSAGLPLAYFLGLSLIHVPGAMVYVGAEDLNYKADATRIGFEQTIIGMIAFLAGVVIARYVFAGPLGQQPGAKRGQDWRRVAAQDRLALIYLISGGFAYFLLLPLLGGVASLTAMISSLGSLLLVGACLRLWLANKSGNRLKFCVTIALLPLLPLATLIQGGFLGFGTYWALTIVTFLFAQSKRRLIYFLLAPAVFFVGLSVFVNYMAARGEIRQLVWHERVGMGDRFSLLEDIFRNFEWLDFSNVRHREVIDARLNQNEFLGLAVSRLESGQVEYASGETFGRMIVALVPRVFWPDKPVVGGGGSVIHDFTGLELAEGTSFGAGQVFEFYVNFGTLGVIGGFLIYGWLIGRMDLSVMKYLWQGDDRRFLFWFLIALALLQPGGNLVEITASAVSAAITACVIGYLSRLSSAHDTGSLSKERPTGITPG